MNPLDQGEVVPRRTLGLETLRCRPGRNRKRVFGKLTDVDGSDLLHQFYGLFIDLDRDLLRDDTKSRYLRIERVQNYGRSVLVVAESGYYGEAGQTIDVRTHETTHQRTNNQSATVRTRLLFTVPPGSEVGLFAVERQGASGAGPKLTDLFRQSLLGAHPTFSFDQETVLEENAWAEAAQLLEVTAVAYGFAPDIADGLGATPTPLGKLEHTLVPEGKNKYLPQWLWTALRQRKLAASDFIGFGGDRGVDETIVTVQRDGRRKTFSLEQERVPSLRFVLSEDGSPPLTDTQFLRQAQDEARDFYQGMGLTWEEQWREGQWTPKALATRLAPHRPDTPQG